MFCIVGADGFFGSYMLKCVMASGSEKILALNHRSKIYDNSRRLRNENFELSDEASQENAARILNGCENIYVFFTAAVHNPDIIKNEPEKALKINTECYASFLDKIKNADIKKFIYTSSDTVYGESINGHVFTEKDGLKPVNIYGEQKRAAEKLTLDAGFTAARYPYLAGPSLNPRKKHFFDSISDKLKNGEKIYMMTDYIRSSVSYKTAAELTYKFLLSGSEENIINICGDFPGSKYELGLKAARHINADPSLVIPSSAEELGIFSEKRAASLIMDNSLLKKELNIKEEIKLEF